MNVKYMPHIFIRKGQGQQAVQISANRICSLTWICISD